MNLMMITLLTIGGAVGQVPTGGQETAAMEEFYEDCYEHGMRGGHAGVHPRLQQKHAIHNTSPQTCYSPRFGCYHSNERHMNRYPAFHGTFYRQAYNYRNYFDYPWHAQPHEPTSLFSYNVGEDQPESAPAAAPPAPPQALRSAPAAQPANPTPARRVLQQSDYTAPPPTSRRLGGPAPSSVEPASASEAATSRRMSGGSSR